MVLCLPVVHGVAIKNSKTTPHEESIIKILPPSKPLNRFFSFHLDLSLHIEVLMVIPSRRKMIPTAPSSRAQSRLSPENLHTKKQATASTKQYPDRRRQPKASLHGGSYWSEEDIFNLELSQGKGLCMRREPP